MTRTAVVVGAGVFGLSVARELVFRGWSVRLVDVHCPGSHGPSAAETRILRFSYGDNGRYPALAKRALRMWQELERESGRKLLVPSGVLVLGLPAPDSGAWEQASARQLNRLGIPVEIMGATAAARRFPEFDCQASGTVLFEPWGAILRAKEATLALAESACDRGAELVQAAAHPSDGSALVNGERLQADVTVWAVGSALPTLFPGLTSVREVRQDSWYLRPHGRWIEPDRPAWLDRAHGYYGVPAVGVLGVKVVPDLETPPDAPDGVPPSGLPRAIRDYLRTRLPDLIDAPVLHRQRCSYALTSDENFLLARHPAHRDVWIVGGDSGHGFKHGPAWGEYVCNVIEGKTAAPPHFALR